MSRIGILLFSVTILLAIIGVFVLYETSSYVAHLNIGDKYFFVKYQTLWVVAGIFASIIIAKLNYKSLYNLSLPLLLVSIFLLFLPFFPGIGLELKGAHRWIHLGFFVLQPSELLKITLTLYLAAWLSNKEKGRLPAFLLLFSSCIALVVLEPDMGTAAIIAITAIVVYFLANATLRDMAFIFLLFIVGIFLFINTASYRTIRYSSFVSFDPKNISTASYHVRQILIALGSGGAAGVGFGKSVQKYAYLPESTTDSIFSLFAEEAGFVGSSILIFLFLTQLVLGFLIAARAPDTFGRLLAGGISIFIGTQTLVNLASQVVLLPLTGVPLPFISYGGSSMLINFFSLGILLNISRHSLRFYI